MWRESEELDLEWLLRRLRGEEPQTEPMKAGEALHKALENAPTGESMMIESGEYKFYFMCDSEVELLPARELSFEKQYGELTVRGRVDGMKGLTLTDYKTTGNFDADRLLEGYQWRFYLDMTECNTFIWKVFEIKERFFKEYDIWKTHELQQIRYPGLQEDCRRLACDFLIFVEDLERANTPWTRTAVLEA
jgi:hypothetical protein